MAVMDTEQRTTTFTVRPFATVSVDGDAADLLDAVLSALEDDSRALSPACGYDHEKQQISAIFQVELALGSQVEDGAQRAHKLFDLALEHAGVSARTSGIAVVEGDDPDQLP